MNFKTTIALIVILAGVGVYLFVNRSGENPAASTSTPAESKKLIDIPADDVTKLTITPAAGKTVAFEKTGGDWKIVEPIKAEADKFSVDELVRDIVGIESRGQLDADKKADNGLDHPPYTVQITGKDKTVKLLVGDKPPLGDTLAVMIEGQDKPEIVDGSLYGKLDKKVSTYRKTKLIDTASDQIRQVRIVRGKQTLVLQKNGSDWQIVEPTKMPADSSSVENILFAITGLNANGFDDDDTPADTGLVKPRLTVWFSTAAPSTQPTTGPATSGTTIKIGGYEDVTNKNVFAMVDNGPIAKVAASTLDSFKKAPLELRDKAVLNIDPDRVDHFTLTVNKPSTTQPTTQPAVSREYTVERRKVETAFGPSLPGTAPTTKPAATQPSSKWIFKSGGEADDTAVSTLLGAVHPLNAQKFLPDASAATTQPVATYVLTISAGPGAGTGPSEHVLSVTDPGAEKPLIGTCDGLTFELDRSLAKTLETDVHPTK